MSFGGGTQRSTSTSGTKFDPQLKGAFLDTYKRGQAIADMPYQGYAWDRMLPFSPLELEGMGGVVSRSRYGGRPEVESAISSAYDVSQFRPSDTSYLNPYIDPLIQATVSDLERSRQMRQQQIGGEAIAARAFGGARHGLREAAVDEASARAEADAVAQLRYDMARTGIGAEGDAARTRLSGASTLADLTTDEQSARYADAMRVAQVGEAMRGMDERFMEDRYQRFLEERDFPYRGLDVLRGVTGILPSPAQQFARSSSRGWDAEATLPGKWF